MAKTFKMGGGLTDAFHAAMPSLGGSPNGGASLDLHPETLMPLSTGKARSGRVQSPAQHASVKKAAAASVARRKMGRL